MRIVSKNVTTTGLKGFENIGRSPKKVGLTKDGTLKAGNTWKGRLVSMLEPFGLFKEYLEPISHRHSTFEDAANCEVCSARARQQRNSLFLNTDAIMLYIAIVLFIWELFFEHLFHEHNLQVWEFVFVLVAYLLAGGTVLTNAIKTVLHGDFFDENVLMVIATAGALAIHAYSEAIGIMIFFKIGELMQSLAVARSRRSITSLLASKPEIARVHTSSGIIERVPEEVAIGEEVTVRPGEKIPLDGVVLEGK